ncbi:MAG: metal ABC transporter ATP-binding protein [Lachnospiraceae bacterium]|nr:metal ABC transporter ATP-binding protein [Lachnospiraceae bacterium]
MAFIECKNAAFGYEGKAVAEQLNFKVEEGNYLCVVGENGSGKSTLMKGILGLISPMEGELILSDGLKKNEIGYLPQQTDIQKNFPASVYEVVVSGRLNRLGNRIFFGRKDRQEAYEKMKIMGIYELRNRSYQELSGGQRQRVLLARALCATQKVLLLDEPVTGLDPATTKEMYRCIRDLNRKHGIAVIMISHDIGTAVREATHILQLAERQIFFGTTQGYKRSKVGRAWMEEDRND